VTGGVAADTGMTLRAAADGAVQLPYLVAVLPADGPAEPVPVAGRAAEDQPGGAGGPGGWVAEGASARFRASATATRTGQDRWAVALEVTCTSEQPVDAGLRVELRLGETEDPGWLVPGVFYGENRHPACTRLYPRFTTASPDLLAMEAAEWSLRADRAATPAVFGWDDRGGAALVTTERSPLGQAGVGFAMDGGRPLLRLHFPYREEPLVYDGSERPLPSDLPHWRWRPGQSAVVEFGLYLLGPDRHGYTGVLREVHARTPALGEDAAWVSVPEAAELAAWGLYRWHYRPDPPVLLETAAFDRHALGERGDRQAMHVSWVSGVPYAHALLLHGRRRDRGVYTDAAVSVLDHVVANLAPAGTFWGQWTAARGWEAGWTADPRRLHSRTLGEAALFLLRAAAAERAAGHPRPDWEAAVRSNLDVAIRGQGADGALGAAHDAHTGEILDWTGSAGLAWVPALVEAAAAFGEPRYLESARLAGRYYLAALRGEFLCGAPEDVDLAPTSEDGYVAVMAYLLLHEADPAGPWLAAARHAADWTLTFRYTYDVAFGPHTLLGRYGFRTRGGDQASPANQHLHSYGLICGPELARLGRYCADPYYSESARENLACFRQFVAREDGDFNAYRGMVTERFYQTACFQPKGMVLTLSHAWCVGMLLYACEASIAGAGNPA
jgi:hypothetical protein